MFVVVAEISSRLLTYGKEGNNLNKKGTFLNPHIVFLSQIIPLFFHTSAAGMKSLCNQPLRPILYSPYHVRFSSGPVSSPTRRHVSLVRRNYNKCKLFTGSL